MKLTPAQIYKLPMPHIFYSSAVWKGQPHDLSSVKVEIKKNGSRSTTYLDCVLVEAENARSNRGDDNFETIADALIYLEDGCSINIVENEAEEEDDSITITQPEGSGPYSTNTLLS